MEKKNGLRLALFASGTLFGTAGLKILGSSDAKRVYSHIVAALLRGKDCVMDYADKVQSGASDIYAEATMINAIREEEEFEDFSEFFDEEDFEDEEDDENGNM